MKLVAVIGFVASLAVFASPSAPFVGKSYLYEYDGGQTYEIQFEDEALTWKGIKGFDAGTSERDEYQFFEVSPRVYLIHWKEKDLSFVDTVLNLETMRVYSSGHSGPDAWFRQGPVKPL
jgi:phenolic acid decarboxylase